MMQSVYASSKIFHFHSKLQDMLNGLPSAPIHVRLKPTNRCSHGCSYCCYRNVNLHLAEEMDKEDQIPREKMAGIVNDFSEMGVRAVTLSGGGEPLEYPYIADTIRSLHHAGIKVAVLTNGFHLEGPLADLMATAVVWVRISMDSASPEGFALNHRSSRSVFERICRNVANFSKLQQRTCVLGLNYVVTRENHQDLYAFLKMMKHMGVDHVKVSEAVVSTEEEENIRYMAPFQAEAKNQIEHAVSQLSGGGYSIVDMMPHITEGSRPPSGYMKPYDSCPVIQYLTVVGADLRVYTCQDKAYSRGGVLGSIVGRSFRDVWFDEKTWERLRTLDPRSECHHHCTANAKNLLLHEFLRTPQEHLDFV